MADGLRREERLEEMEEVLLGDAAPRVRHLDRDPAVPGDERAERYDALGGSDRPRGMRHVHDQVGEHLAEADRAPLDERHGFVVSLDPAPVASIDRDEAKRSVERRGHVGRALGVVLARKSLEITDDSLNPYDAVESRSTRG